MKAIWNDIVVAEAPQDELIRIEGNWYFPPSRVNREFFADSDTHTTCFWKGEASYYNVTVNGETNKDAGWYYPDPKEGSIERVRKDFSHFVAFWHGVVVD